MADPKPGVWKPRWRTEGAGGPSVTFYAAAEIAKALGCQTSHTFVRSTASSPDAADDQVVAVFNHLKANPSAPKELWTRNSFDLIQRSVGVPVPFFSESPAKPHRYELTGWYAIESVEIVKGGSPEVKAFIAKREESKGKKSTEAWASALREVCPCLRVSVHVGP